jgi:hypothetical protein
MYETLSRSELFKLEANGTGIPREDSATDQESMECHGEKKRRTEDWRPRTAIDSEKKRPGGLSGVCNPSNE